MKKIILLWALLAVVGLRAQPAFGLDIRPALDDAPVPLTLEQAISFALANHPLLKAGQTEAEAAKQHIRQARADFYPQISANVSAVGATPNTRIGAGPGLTNPSVFNHQSDGLNMTQLITDFGRTSALTDQARFLSEAAMNEAQLTESQVLLDVYSSYFDALKAAAVLKIAHDTVNARSLLLDRVQALANSKLKSGLDVSFAQVAMEDARLLQLDAENNMNAANARLSSAMGFQDYRTYQLTTTEISWHPPEDVAQVIHEALSQRPEIAELKARREASIELAKAEQALQYPTVTAMAAVGYNPIIDDPKTSEGYLVGGVNMSWPMLNGGKLSARGEEAELHARSAELQLNYEENKVTRDSRISWLGVQTSNQRVKTARQLRKYAREAEQLAQARYDLGASSIVELAQAQLNRTDAEIKVATAKFDLQIALSQLQFEIGLLK
jgi:outer membrane protein